MSGFLDSLLARSRGTAAVVRPRLTSLFEPDAPRADVLDGQASAEFDSEVAATVAGAGDVPEGAFASPRRAGALSPVAASSRASSPDPGGTVHVGSSSLAAIPEAGNLLPARRPAPIARSAEPRALAAASGTSHRDDDAGLERPDRETTRRALAEDVTAAPDERDADPDPRSGMWPLATATRQRIARASSPASGASATMADRRAARGSADIERPAAAAVESRLVAPAVAAPALAPPPGSRVHFEPVASRRRTAAADPIVEVSIGRIEVRAAVERGPGRSGRQSSAVMGLDEYLRTRARGGSR